MKSPPMYWGGVKWKPLSEKTCCVCNEELKGSCAVIRASSLLGVTDSAHHGCEDMARWVFKQYSYKL